MEGHIPQLEENPHEWNDQEAARDQFAWVG
jgi:hypothetical protein